MTLTEAATLAERLRAELHRVIIGRVYHHAVRLLFGLTVRDVDCDFRLVRRRVFDTVTLA